MVSNKSIELFVSSTKYWVKKTLISYIFDQKFIQKGKEEREIGKEIKKQRINKGYTAEIQLHLI